MCIVLAVARIAVRGQSDLGDVLGHVAGLAIETAVRPRQGVSRLRIVIKAPHLPAIRIVAERAIRAQTPLVMLVAMAGGAILRCAFKPQRAMATLARCDGVASNQRELRDVVVERGYAAPTDLTVTLLAAAAKLALVAIILMVARYTSRRQLVAIKIAGVACIAFDFGVGGSQRKFRCLVMIEVNRTPFILVVAGFTFGTVSPTVNVLNPVAIGACRTDPFVTLTNMARGAEDCPMCPLKRELGLVMIEQLDPSPCRLDMAILTCLSEAPLVPIACLMTVEAAPGSLAELGRLQVAAAALHRFVRITQLKIRKAVIESLTIELDDVGVSPLVIGVTVGAVLLRRVRLPSVKSLVSEPIRRDFFVACQAEACLRFS
jgi:hypothetical protein